MIALAVALSLPLLGAAPDSTIVSRVNQVGYLPDAPKVAVTCGLDSSRVTRVTRTFVVRDDRGRVVYGPRKMVSTGAFGPCARTWRLDFSELRRAGRYRIAAFGVTSRELRIDAHAYDGGADTLLYYMREQRSGWNPLIGDSVHTHDGIVVDDSGHAGKAVAVSGGWADASDYLQYVTTSANATYMMLLAYRDHRDAFADDFDTRGAVACEDCHGTVTKRVTASTGSYACSPATAKCTTRSATIAITCTSICRGPIRRTMGGGRERSVPCIRARDGHKACSGIGTARRGSRPPPGSTHRHSASARSFLPSAIRCLPTRCGGARCSRLC